MEDWRTFVITAVAAFIGAGGAAWFRLLVDVRMYRYDNFRRKAEGAVRNLRGMEDLLPLVASGPTAHSHEVTGDSYDSYRKHARSDCIGMVMYGGRGSRRRAEEIMFLIDRPEIATPELFASAVNVFQDRLRASAVGLAQAWRRDERLLFKFLA